LILVDHDALLLQQRLQDADIDFLQVPLLVGQILIYPHDESLPKMENSRTPSADEVTIWALAQGGLSITLKNPHLFLQGIKTKTLWHETLALQQQGGLALHVLEGNISQDEGKLVIDESPTGFSVWALRMAVIRMTWAGVPVLQIEQDAFLDLLTKLHEHIRKQQRIPDTITPPKPLVPVEPEVQFLSDIPGIASKRASDLSRIGTLAEVLEFLTDPKSLGSPKRPQGIGQNTFAGARRFLGLSPYKRLAVIDYDGEDT